MPKAFMEKLKKVPLIIGHERCASSSFSDSGTLVICANHGYGLAVCILHDGRYFYGCRECIQEMGEPIMARTEEKPRGLYVSLDPGKP